MSIEIPDASEEKLVHEFAQAWGAYTDSPDSLT